MPAPPSPVEPLSSDPDVTANYERCEEKLPQRTYELGWFTAMCLILNHSIGTGIFATPSKMILGIDNVRPPLIMWVFGGLTALSGLDVWNQLGLSVPRKDRQSVPRRGGKRDYFGYMIKSPKFLVTCIYGIAWFTLGNLSGNAIQFGVYVIAAAGYDNPPKAHVLGIAITAVTLAVLVHDYSRGRGIFLLNNMFAVFKVFLLLAMIILGALRKSGRDLGGGRTETKNLHQPFSGTSIDLANYIDSLLCILYSYSGFKQLFYALGNAENSGRIFSYATNAAVLIQWLLFVPINVAYLWALDLTRIQETAADDYTGPSDIATLFFESIFGTKRPTTKRVMIGLLAVSVFGNIVVITFTAARVKQEVSKEGILPSWLVLVNKILNAPSDPIDTLVCALFDDSKFKPRKALDFPETPGGLREPEEMLVRKRDGSGHGSLSEFADERSFEIGKALSGNRDFHPRSGGEKAYLDHTWVFPKTASKGDSSLSLSILKTGYNLLWSAIDKYTKEPPLVQGEVRVRWKCKCGKRLYDDFRELRPGAAIDLAKSFDHSAPSGPPTGLESLPNRHEPSEDGTAAVTPEMVTGSPKRMLTTIVDITEATPDSIAATPGITTPPSINTAAATLAGKRSSGQTPNMNGPGGPPTSCGSILNAHNPRSINPYLVPLSDPLFLLTCMRFHRYGRILHQIPLHEPVSVASDRQLMSLLRDKYSMERRTWLRTFFSFQTVTGIDFVNFELHSTGLADIRKRNDIPPPNKKGEYHYRPLPADTIPPLGRNYLAHLLKYPEHAKCETMCLSRLPKRMKERLQVRLDGTQTGGGMVLPVGWGIEFVEGIDWNTVLVYFVVLMALSLIVGVSWSQKKGDVQGGFAIGGYVLMLLTPILALVQIRVNE